jgi:hydroxymethylbilane synthase
LRGNVPTRIQKLRDGNYDAIMLAKAGVDRLQIDLSEFHVEELSAKEFIPAPAQGVLAYQVRENDSTTKQIISQLNHSDVAACIHVERTILNRLDGGCQLPLGAYCEHINNEFHVWVSAADTWESTPVRLYRTHSNAEELINTVLERLKKKSTPQRIFLSREVEETSLLKKFSDSFGHTLIAKSCINITHQKFSLPDHYDWVFFTSKNAVNAFFSQHVKDVSKKYAAVGSGTAKALQAFVKHIHFIGDGETTEVAKQFLSQLAPNEKVLFPISNVSLQTMQNPYQNLRL